MPVHYETEGSVAVVTIDRPEVRNAVDRPTAAALIDACDRFEADDVSAVMVLTGAGGTSVPARTSRRWPIPTASGSTGWRSTATDRWARPGGCSTNP